jgi:hypothetical protein
MIRRTYAWKINGVSMGQCCPHWSADIPAWTSPAFNPPSTRTSVMVFSKSLPPSSGVDGMTHPDFPLLQDLLEHIATPWPGCEHCVL